jgi:glyoxylate reductase
VKCLVTRQLPLDTQNLLKAYFTEVLVVEKGRPLTSEELLSYGKGSHTIICQLTDRFSRDVIKALPALKHLATFSAGVDHIDREALKEKGIKLSYTPGILTEATADLAWALILGCARRIKPAMRLLESGKFLGFGPSDFLGVELQGATLGIIGHGKIGKAVAKRGQEGFGMKVYVHSPSSFESISLEELLKVSDIVSLHCPLTPKTRHLVGQKELAVMKPGAILINTARGPVVDEKALARHLKDWPDFFAGLDVFENEPVVEKDLHSLPNCLALPHIGSATIRTRAAMARICIEEAIRFVKSEKLQYECNL